MRVFVTGATGFIGSHLCRGLIAAGHPTRALIRPTSSLALIDDLALELVIGDLMDFDSLVSAMKGVDVVIHCGANVGGWRDRQAMVDSHILGTKYILEAALKTGANRLIYTSSVAALGVSDRPPRGMPPPLMDEGHTWNYKPDHWPYGFAKHRTEQEVLHAVEAGLDAVILNPAAVIGPGDKNLVASAIVYHMDQGRRPPIPPGGLNIIHIEDLIDGYIAAIERGRTGERYILGSANISFEEFLQTIAEVIDVPRLRLRLPDWVFSNLAGIVSALQPLLNLPVRGHLFRMVGRYFYYDIRKMREELGVSPSRSTREAIEAAHAWYQANPGLIRQ